MGFVNTLAYRLRYYTGIVTYFIYVTVYYFIWKAIYEHSSAIEGFDFSHILTYIAVGWIIRSFYFKTLTRTWPTRSWKASWPWTSSSPSTFKSCIWRAQRESPCFGWDADAAHGGGAVAGLSLAPARQPGTGSAFLVSVMLSFLIVAAINFAVGRWP